MPLALLLALGLLGAGGVAYMARRGGSVFDVDSCIYDMKRKGYLNKDALEICKKKLEAIEASQKSSFTYTLNQYLIPLVVVGGMVYVATKLLGKGREEKERGRVIVMSPVEIDKLKETVALMKESAKKTTE